MNDSARGSLNAKKGKCKGAAVIGAKTKITIKFFPPLILISHLIYKYFEYFAIHFISNKFTTDI